MEEPDDLGPMGIVKRASALYAAGEDASSLPVRMQAAGDARRLCQWHGADCAIV
jgi:hypothetical protein